ncbi:hypothetical protein HS088_TW05G00196 [Tripterygium wilfordii]|uniref:Nuclear condensin complex subunit 3 C-terminal domain-containing protein n=1 Tax=Tripterygium wilfordii TaxID=458696 RepID=A0A7J7DM87_TRIWF|nr:condensin complex subunit 3 [Tripterygium wilfordii]KAF5747475.1 hypothetical protein HS088_TW05G00196 [Tripterygium wilfordii]
MGGREGEKKLMQQIAKILDEARTSNATHLRKLKELSAVRSKSPSPAHFVSAFSKTLTPIFLVQRRIASAERIIRFVAAFASTRNNDPDCDCFLEEFLKFLLVAASSASKTARFRACQITSEIIMQLPDDAEVSNELWDEVIECMKIRALDKVPGIRTFAVRALSRFINDAENGDILDLFLEVLPLEQNVEVRKTIVLSLPPSNATSQVIIDCTVDASESVRKAAYHVLANRFPLQSLSIKLRTLILQRGVADRSEVVSKECLKLMKDEWFAKCCDEDPVKLLKYLDVETYEYVGESVMVTLLKAGLVKLHDSGSINQHILSSDKNEGDPAGCAENIQLMEPEVSLFWRTVCKHLQTEAQAKGSDAASTMGAEAGIYAAEASDNNDLLERILPATVSDFIVLAKAHIDTGPNYRFASRQLLLLGAILDFSDSTNRKLASAFVKDLLHQHLEHEEDDEGNKIVIGDGINLGGDRDWADAVSSFAMKVHAASGEFEEIVLEVIEELAQPCRERTADFMQWMHCLAVTSLLLENAKSFRWLQCKAIGPDELLQSLLLPGAKHVHLDVQRAAVRCLGLFGLLEKKPSEELVKQLRLSYIKGPAPISTVACKALLDLIMWHGPQEVDRALRQDLSSKFRDETVNYRTVNLSEIDGDLNIELLDLLYAGLDQNDCGKSTESDENDRVEAVLGEGFAKILLLSEKYPSIPASLHPLILAKLINLYFSNETTDQQRLKQCLSVFFEHYPSLSANHKKCLSKAYVLVMRSMWPGIYGNAGGSALIVSNKRKRAVQASRFMLQMMQAPIYVKDAEIRDESCSGDFAQTIDASGQPSFECGEEGLAIHIATEVARFHAKKTPAEKAYVSALCRILVLLHFRSSEQVAIKLMRRLLNLVVESILTEKDLVKELKRMAEHLQSLNGQQDEELSQDQANIVLGRLELDFDLDINSRVAMPETPAPRSTRPSHTRRRVRCEESSDEEHSPTSVVPPVTSTLSTRSQRASKTAAMTKMTVNRGNRIDENDEGEEGSELTSEEDSDVSEHYGE